MKDLGEASYILGIKLHRDRRNRMIGLSQASYIDKILERFSMVNSKKGFLPFRHGVTLSKDQCPKTPEEREAMRRIPYASAIGSLMYAMLCMRPDICFAVGMVSRYQSDQDLRRSTSGYALTLDGGADSWRSVKQKSEVDSTT